MTGKPNAFQRALHIIFSQRLVTQFFAPITEPADKLLLALTRGRHTFTKLVGWPVIELVTSGARTGQPRSHLLIGLRDGEKIAVIGSNFGSRRHPAWVHNLRAHPKCVVRLGGQSRNYLARETDGEERQQCWQLALSYYRGYAAYEKRAAPRRISVWVLEPL